MSERGDGRDESAADRAGHSDARRLPEELRALGKSLDPLGATGESMAERVIAQIIAESIPVPVAEPLGRRARLRSWVRARWRVLTAALCGLLTAAVLTPPVRAAVFEWFDFGGVEVRYDPSATPPAKGGVPGCGGGAGGSADRGSCSDRWVSGPADPGPGGRPSGRRPRSGSS